MQNRRAILFLVLALVLGTFAALTAQRWLENQRSLPAEVARADTKPVAVVRGDTAVGSLLAARGLVTVDWPLEFVPQGAHSDPSQLEGRVLRRPLAAGEPVLESALLPEGSRAGLVSVIDPSLRAMSVKVDAVVGVAGFVSPGTHVDVVVTVKRRDRQPYSRIILQDVEVLAIDQKLQEADEGNPELVSVVTLAVSPEQAQKLAFGMHEGKLQLALRNPTDREIVDLRTVSVDQVLGVTKPRARAPRAVSRTNVEVLKGAQLSVETF